MSVTVMKTEYSVGVMQKHKIFSGDLGDLCDENFDYTVRFQLRRKDEWTRRVRRDRLHGVGWV